ncbi:helix-turn-helix domain-containing protein [Streptomyces sp. ME19-01-6]|uniref:helix-turn-helix domain-containing protein n=1 Tax=Streptomyces sp. ME19-01-6 TaxID=3028686 RepID=UPI0029A9C875|nr:helix-turn-helix domain-containing protein [Streptomyces sp. ME19-01-6]MDX3226575.1 helix-turn-helix domain-containing protein [Streptomyces sp. ME19-01-6]
MQLRYQYRVTLTPAQRIRAARVFGCRRVVWNDALAMQKPRKASNKLLGSPRDRITEGPYQPIPKNAELGKTLITAAKKTEQRAFPCDAPVGVMQQTLRDLDAAWKAHEDSKTGSARGRSSPRRSSRVARTIGRPRGSPVPTAGRSSRPAGFACRRSVMCGSRGPAPCPPSPAR